MWNTFIWADGGSLKRSGRVVTIFPKATGLTLTMFREANDFQNFVRALRVICRSIHCLAPCPADVFVPILPGPLSIAHNLFKHSIP